MGFVQRYRSDPTLEQLTRIEQTAIVDIAPPQPSVGQGTGNVLVTGQFEDGPFSAGGDSLGYDPDKRGILEIFTSADLEQKFGSFGFVRSGVGANDPCARIAAGELWNGSGFIKLKYLKTQRLFVARVDQNVGEVQVSPRATLCGTNSGPFAGMVVGAWASFDLNVAGAAAADSIAATAATTTGGGAPAGLIAGDAVTLEVDGGAPITIAFDGTSSAIADVVNVINAAMGATIASNSAGNLALTGAILGTNGALNLLDVVAGVVVKLGFAGGSPEAAAGTGNVANLSSVTAAELAAIFNGTAGLAAGSARVDSQQRICVSAVTSVLASGAQVTIPGFSTTLVSVGDQLAGLVPAGTRVSDGTTTYLTLQTLTFAAAATAAQTVKVRHALDDGLGIGAGGGTVTTVTDQPDFVDLGVTNALAITVALTDAQMDVRYTEALAGSLAMNRNPSKNATLSIVARRTEPVIRDARQNALDAETAGLRGRLFIGSAPLGFSPDAALTDVAQWRTDRLAYTYPGWQVRIPEIAARGADGGVGFTENGIITVRGDAPLTSLCAVLNPEENPGQATDGIIDEFFELEDIGRSLEMSDYIAFKAAGIAAPIIDEDSGPEYQSGVTSSLTSGRETLARRKMADFIQDSMASIAKPYQKTLNRVSNRDSLTSRFDSFLGGLLSANAVELQRIEGYLLDDESGNTAERLALGIGVWLTTVRTLSSLDAIVIRTEVGPNATVSTVV